LKQAPVTFYYISICKRGKEKGGLSPVRKEAKEFLKKADFGLITVSPDEKIGKGKLRDHRRRLGEELIKERFVFEG
jgi:hypothetical protein